MNWKRGILTGILFWVLIFFEVSILMFGFSLQAGTLYYIIHFIVLILLVLISALIYFQKAKPGWKQGLFLGIIYIIVGIILDSIITIPLFMKLDYSFLIRSDILIGYIETIVLCVIFGAIRK